MCTLGAMDLNAACAVNEQFYMYNMTQKQLMSCADAYVMPLW